MPLIILVMTFLAPFVRAESISVSFSDSIPQSVRDNAQRLIDQKLLSTYQSPSQYRAAQVEPVVADLVETAARPFGYFSAACKASLIGRSPNTEFAVNCTMNQPTRVKRIHVDIVGPGRDQILAAMQTDNLSAKGLHAGDVFNTDTYESHKIALLDLCRHHGFLNATADGSRVLIDTDQYTAEIDLHIDTMRLYSFGPIMIEQKDYDPDYLRSLAAYSPGDSFSDQLLIQYRDNLESTNLFTYVTVMPFTGALASKQIPTQVFYEPTPKLQYGLGTGFSSGSNLFYNATIRRNRLSSRGARATMELLSSSNLSYGVGTLSIPRSHPTKDYVNLQLGHKREYIEFVGVDRTTTMSASHITLQRSRPNRAVRQETSLHYSVDSSKVDGTGSSVLNHFLYPSLDYGVFYRYPDHDLTVHWLNSVMANLEAFISPTDFIKFVLEQKILYGISPSTQLSVRLKQGYIATSHSNKPLPISWFFYTGGAYSVRGFSYNSIGAEPSVTFEQNNYLYTASVELQRRLYQDVFAIGFCDLGDATSNIDLSRTSIAVGTGLLWKSFVGNLEVSLARPLQNHSSDPSKQARLNIRIYQPISAQSGVL